MAAPERDALRYPGFIDVIDVSSCQGSHVDWQRVKAAGFVAAIIKLTDGVHGRDPSAARFLAGAAAAGLYTIIYHFAHVDQDPDAQAKAIWDACGDEMPYRVVVDLETAPLIWTPDQVARAGLHQADAIEQRFGRPPVLYDFVWFSQTRIEPALRADLELADAYARLPLWMAQYMSTTTPWVPPIGFRTYTPSPWTKVTLHQYSGNGGFRVPGIPGVDCDRSLFNGDLRTFREDFLGLPPIAQSDPTIPIIHPSVPMPPVEIVDDSDDEPPPSAA